MNGTITLIIGALAIASVAVVEPASAEPPPHTRFANASVTHGPGPEHARLTALVGTWDVELTFWFKPGSPGIVSKGVSTIRPLFDGLFIEEKIEGALNGVPFTTLAWTGFNTGTRQYEATRIASTNTSRIPEAGTWDEATKRFGSKESMSWPETRGPSARSSSRHRRTRWSSPAISASGTCRNGRQWRFDIR